LIFNGENLFHFIPVRLYISDSLIFRSLGMTRATLMDIQQPVARLSQRTRYKTTDRNSRVAVRFYS